MALPVPASGFLQAKDLNETPREFEVAKEAEYKEAKQFGHPETGMSYFYFLKDEEGEYEFQNNSIRLAKAWNAVDPQVGEKVTIARTGDGMTTQYAVVKV